MDTEGERERGFLSEAGSNEAVANLSQRNSSEISREEVDSLLDGLGQQSGGDVNHHGNPQEAPTSNSRIQVAGPAMLNMMERFGMRMILGTEAAPITETLRNSGHVFTTEKEVTSQAERTRAAEKKQDRSKRMEGLAMRRLQRLTRKYPRRSRLLLVSTAQLIQNASGAEKFPDDPVDMEWLSSLSNSSVKTITALAFTNVGTGHTVYGVHESTVHFRRIPESVASSVLSSSLPLVPLDHPELRKYVDRVDGSRDSVVGIPMTLFNTLSTDVMRISVSEMIARENALTLDEMLPSVSCLRASALVLAALVTAGLLYLVWHFNAEHAAHLTPLALLTRDGFTAVAFHGASVLLEPALLPAKQRLLSQVRGRVVEIGAGAGANLELYPSSLEELVLVEPNTVLQSALRKRADGADLGSARVSVLGQQIEDVTLEPRSVDYAVLTLSLNCVASSQRVLEQVYGWLKPGGKMIVMEPISAPWRGQLSFRAVEWLAERTSSLLWGGITGGCHLGRETLSRLQTLKGTRFKDRQDVVVPWLGLPVVTAVLERIT